MRDAPILLIESLILSINAVSFLLLFEFLIPRFLHVIHGLAVLLEVIEQLLEVVHLQLLKVDRPSLSNLDENFLQFLVFLTQLTDHTLLRTFIDYCFVLDLLCTICITKSR
jgi:hypothetical protein